MRSAPLDDRRRSAHTELMNGSRKVAALALLLTWNLPTVAEGPVTRWVPADEAVVEGRLAASAFDHEAQVQLERWMVKKLPEPPGAQAAMETSDPECDIISVTLYQRELVPPERVLAEAAYAAFGTVTQIDHGIYRGRLATLVTVLPDRWLRFPSQDPPELIYFLGSDAKISINGIRYCAKGSRKDLLKPGRRVFFGTNNVLQSQPHFLLPYDSELFFETDQGAVSIGVDERPDWSKDWLRFEAQLTALSTELKP
jgi:hypothetical protein